MVRIWVLTIPPGYVNRLSTSGVNAWAAVKRPPARIARSSLEDEAEEGDIVEREAVEIRGRGKNTEISNISHLGLL